MLPLENLSHDPRQEPFVDGMTEALIGDLGKIIPGPGLIAFTGVVVFTMLASQSFDPKLIWNKQ